ncbi:TRAP transporter substrate-binding protein [Ornithinimicrobium faecis]|uniref:TRAP transporter substrate-binding protein n=1 Tax=Ornithinimicrobium faecis TaxID=2934158 RepID=UPI002117DBE4|nr:TRAP transporter substrate-binding protein [Ornithinimicrobium sp. HY1745]
MRTTRLLTPAVALTTALALAACGGRGAGVEDGGGDDENAGGAEEIVLTIGHSQAPTVPMNEGAKKFKELVEEGSGGRIAVEVYPAEELGSEPEMMEGLQMGNVRVAIVATAVAADTCASLGAYALPYILEGETDRDQYENLQALTGSDWNQQLIDDCLAESGYQVIDNSWWYGNRNLTTNKEVNSPEDMAGLVVRTPPADLHTMAILDFGAEAVPMPFSEVYSALDTGVIDGQENPISTIYQNTLYEVQDYLALTRHMTQSQTVLMNGEFFDGLADEDQQLVLDSIREAGVFQSDLQLSTNEEELELLKEEGMTVTEPDLAQFRAATEDSVDAHLETLGMSRDEIVTLQD